MNPINLDDVTQYVEENITLYHQKRLERLKTQELKKVLKRKNPYLFKAKNILTSEELIRSVLDAYLSSQEETIFGEFLENLAIFVSSKTVNGHKSSAEGIDLEFEEDGIHHLVSIKSGPNWGNSSQINKMKTNFQKATRILKTNNKRAIVQAVNGCCYGIDNQPEKGDYQKLCGQRFWEFISGDPHLYIDIVEPLGYRAKERNEEFQTEYARLVNLFILEFANAFFTPDGDIDWEKLLKFNSGKTDKKQS